MASHGSKGERVLQKKVGTKNKASTFYKKQMLDHLNPYMRKFILKQEMVFIATADSKGECDCSFRAGKQGFIKIVDDQTLIFPEYQGNGVMASMGNITENPNIGMTFIDFFENTIGLHVNGKAKIITGEELLANEALVKNITGGAAEGPSNQKFWILIKVEEAYIHCSKHIPHLKKLDKKIYWGTDDEVHKGGDFFNAESSQ